VSTADARVKRVGPPVLSTREERRRRALLRAAMDAPTDAPTETEADAMFGRTTSTLRARVSRNGWCLSARGKKSGFVGKDDAFAPAERSHSCSRRALARSVSFAA